MTDRYINVKVAELLGWKHTGTQRDFHGADWKYLGKHPKSKRIRVMPNYCNDLNACAEFEAGMSFMDLCYYANWIQEDSMLHIVGYTPSDYRRDLNGLGKLIGATARQRCLAFIAVKTRPTKLNASQSEGYAATREALDKDIERMISENKNKPPTN